MDISERIQSLLKMGSPALGHLWLELFRRPAPAGIRKQLLVPILTYKIQEDAFGGLTPASKRRLSQLAATFIDNPKAEILNTRTFKPGTRLLRQWQGKIYQVEVAETCLLYEGNRYQSLSEIARRITGTRWSGPAFFGVKSNSAAQPERTQ